MSGRGEGAGPAVEGRAKARRWLWLPIVGLVLAATPAVITRVKVQQLRQKERALTEAKPKRMSGRAIPLCAGLTIVTAVSQPAGDYESIKTIESVTQDAVRLRYSSEHMVSDLFDAPRFERQVTHRTILRDDLRSAFFCVELRWFERRAFPLHKPVTARHFPPFSEDVILPGPVLRQKIAKTRKWLP